MRFDHVVFAVPDLAAAVAACREHLGLHVAMGGEHPNWGTQNAICHFGLAYLELIAVRDPVRAAQSDFGRSVLAKVHAGGGLVTTALATTDLDAAVARLHAAGVQVDGPFDGRRQRPDGSLLAWRMAWPAAHGTLPMPFLIQWQQTDAEREADLQARGLIVPQPLALESVTYAVSDVAAARAAFERYYGAIVPEITFQQAAHDQSDGPVALRLQGADGSPQVLFDHL